MALPIICTVAIAAHVICTWNTTTPCAGPGTNTTLCVFQLSCERHTNILHTLITETNEADCEHLAAVCK